MATWAESPGERLRTGESPASRPYGVDVSATDEDAHVVGLATETAQLEALLRRVCVGGPVVVVVEGPAGIGKTTLLRRFLRRHPEVPTTAATGLPWESSRAGALARRLLDDDPGDDPARPAGDDPVDLGTALARRWEARAGEEPLLVVVDDAHHADPVSLQAMASAVARTHRAPVLLLLARTTGWPDAGAVEAGAVLDRLAATSVPVLRLGPAETRLLAARVAAADLPLPVARHR